MKTESRIKELAILIAQTAAECGVAMCGLQEIAESAKEICEKESELMNRFERVKV